MIPPLHRDSQTLLLIRTDFSDDETWAKIPAAAGLHACIEPVDELANREVGVAELLSELPSFASGLMVADRLTMTSQEFLVLICPLGAEVAQFRAPAAHLAYVANPIMLGLSNWTEVAGLVNEHGVFSIKVPEGY